MKRQELLFSKNTAAQPPCSFGMVKEKELLPFFAFRVFRADRKVLQTQQPWVAASAGGDYTKCLDTQFPTARH